jgi:Prokaryotic homologs of the JAB domain
MQLPALRLSVAPDVITDFKRQARNAFPRETCAFLLGKWEGNNVEVLDLYVPSDIARHATPDAIDYQDRWFVEAEEEASEAGLVVVGDVHSHPYGSKDPVPWAFSAAQSEYDLDYSPRWGKIAGICFVREQKGGRLMSRVRFWGPMIPLEARDETTIPVVRGRG